MKTNVFLSLALLALVIFLAGCGATEQHLQMLNAGNGEYLYVKPDQSVKGDSFRIGFSLRSTKDGRVVQEFQYAPLEVRLEDFDGDGVKDLVYVIADPKVKGDAFNIGYSMRVALGIGDGSYKPAKVVSTFATIQ